MSSTTIWVGTEIIIEVLLAINLHCVRLNSHGLKSKNYEWISDVIHPDPRNSFDFGFYSESIPQHILLTHNHDIKDNEFFPMLGYCNIGNQQLKLGVDEVQAKIYSTLVHRLKYASGLDWSFSKNITNKSLRRKLESIGDFIETID